MARNVFTTKITGNKSILDDLDVLARDMPELALAGLKAQEEVVENRIRVNWVSIAGGKVGDYVYDSVGQSATFGSNTTDVVGTVGVYNIDSIALAHGREHIEGKRKPMNAAQIAYWVEFGTTRLKSGQRKLKGVEYSEEDLVTISGKPFISNAFYGTLNEQQKAFYDGFKKAFDSKIG